MNIIVLRIVKDLCQIGYHLVASSLAIFASIYYIRHLSNKKRDYTFKIIKKYQNVIEPRIYDLEHNIDNSYNKAKNIADSQWSDKIVHDLNLSSKAEVLNFLRDPLPEDASRIHSAENAYIYKNIFNSIEMITLYISQHMVKTKLVRIEIGPSFMQFMNNHYNEFIKFTKIRLPLYSARIVYNDWKHYYNK